VTTEEAIQQYEAYRAERRRRLDAILKSNDRDGLIAFIAEYNVEDERLRQQEQKQKRA